MTVIRDSSSIAVSDGTATVHGWVQDVRNLGGISFLTLRDRHGTLQVTMPKKKIDPELFEKLTKLPRESVVSITGDVKESNQTALGLELIPTSAEVIGEAAVPLPMGVIDKVNVEMDTRLNHRFMDVRKPEIKAIFELKSIMVDLIEEAVRETGFTRVYTPKLGAALGSGGQREHRYDVLVERMRKKGLDPEDFEFYLEAFRYGMPPHGGWGIGIERFLVKMLDLPNIREAILFPRDPSRLEP